jgi:Iron-regulated ABC transporter ATPase subunit SufC
MLSIKDLQVSVEEKEILRGLNFDVKPGEVHAIDGAKRLREKYAFSDAGRTRRL